MRLEHKVVPIHANTAAGERCHVTILDFYISKLPQEVKQKDFFYARPLKSTPTDPSKPWFATVPVGRNLLASMLRCMFSEAGITGHKTNHSLRATGASELFEAGVPEKIIQQRTGHRSLDALRIYERTTIQQHQAVSNILGSHSKTSYSDALGQTTPQQTPMQPFHNCTVQVFQSPQPQPPPSFVSHFEQRETVTADTSFLADLTPEAIDDFFGAY